VTPEPAARPGTILQSGRAKAYRPLPVEARADAVREGLAAFRRGDAFVAHELFEPAWMGSADTAERELLQGLIKLAAGYVHAARDNPLGVAKNLTGAREHLAVALAVSVEDGARPIAIRELASIDIGRLIADIDRILAAVARTGAVPLQRPTIGHRARD
jgi:Domain of unknown function (DUF309)